VTTPEAARDRRQLLDSSRFNPRLVTLLLAAQDLATANGDLYVGSEHLLLALVNEGRGTAWSVLDQVGQIDSVRQRLERLLAFAAAERERGGRATE
jgi:ATP-dependent Clp protease ATP-binding subunit ClpA